MNLILAERNLVDASGHFFEYCRSLHDLAVSQGFEVRVLAGKSVSPAIRDAIGAQPCFRWTHAARARHGESLLRIAGRRILARHFPRWHVQRMVRMARADLAAALPLGTLSPNTIMLLPTTRWDDVLPVVRWVEAQPPDARPQVGFVFHFTAYPESDDCDRLAMLYRRAFRAIEQSPARSLFRLFADSRRLVAEYRRHTALPVHLLPVPHSHPNDLVNEADGHVAGNTVRRPVRLAYLGSAAVQKGFLELPDLVEKLKQDFEQGRIELEIQANLTLVLRRSYRAAVEQLRGRQGVTLLEKPLATAEYYQLLDRADIVLLPYIANSYRAQTSGVFTEAIAHGKPVIVPDDTWMAEELQSHGAGVVFQRGDHESLCQAVRSAAENLPDLRRRALAGTCEWTRFHNPGRFLDVVRAAFAAPHNRLAAGHHESASFPPRRSVNAVRVGEQ